MGEKEKGLYDKYKVERTDGKPIEGGCLVLEFGDRNAWAAINQFSFSVRNAGYIDLANEIQGKLMGTVDTEVNRIMSMSNEELTREMRAEGLDPDEEVAKFKKIATSVLKQCKAQIALLEASDLGVTL